ncbi:TPA: hypothetical protein ACS70C_001201 [Providencia alcalifaciens]
MKNKLYNLEIVCAFISFVYSTVTYSAVSSTVTVDKIGFNRMGTVTGTVFGPAPAFENTYSNTGGGIAAGAAFLISNDTYNPSTCDRNPSQLTQKSSDGVATGILIAPDIIVGLTGTASGDYTPIRDTNYTIVTATGIWESDGTFDSSAAKTASGYTWCGGANTSNPTQLYWKKGHQYSSKFTGSWFVYIGPNAKKGTYPLKTIILGRGQYNNGVATTLIDAGNITYIPPIQCTINTPPKIDFGKVNIWEWEGNTSGTPGGNRKDILGSVDGNFTINCTGDSNANAPAKLTLKGTIQGYSNDLKMTMDATGEVAPATVRASIKSIIAPCSSGGTSFGTGGNTPPSNEVNLGELTVGQHLIPYRFSLCALGEGFKSGAASASATITIDWE